ncbi:MAG: radical SAM protein [Nitrospina sp.]|nr:radical SAM protein [Nitrospina sp.]
MIYLVFPSSWHPSQPYLSLPALKGFLHQHGIEDVVQRDLAIELLDHLCTWEKAQPLFARIQDEFNQMRQKPYLNDFEHEKIQKLAEAVEIIPSLCGQIDAAKASLRCEDFYDLDRYMESLKIIDVWLDNILAAYFPSQLTVIGSQLRWSPYSTWEILESFEHPEENFFHDLYRQFYLPEIIKEDIELLGISITSVEQVLPGLSLAHLVRQARPDIHITVGGSIFTKLVDVLEKGSPLFDFVDSFVVHEGETPLLKLVQALRSDQDFSKVPNLVYKDGETVKVNRPFYKEELNALPTPDFDGMPFDLYLSPERVLPVVGSRGCYWERCAFCSIPFDHIDFHVRYAETVANDFKNLHEKYGCNYFFFTDEALPINFLKTFSQKLVDMDLDIRWTGELKFEKSLLKDDRLEVLHKSGCRKLIFGMESYNQRVLDFMKKGCPVEVIDETVERCMEIGIGIHLYLLIGFPTETREEVYDSVNFVLKNPRLLNSTGFSCITSQFDLEKSTPMAKSPEEYKVYNFRTPEGHDLALGYSYDIDEGLTAEEATDLYQEVLGKLHQVVATFPHNYSLADGLLYLGHEEKEKSGHSLAAY